MSTVARGESIFGVVMSRRVSPAGTGAALTIATPLTLEFRAATAAGSDADLAVFPDAEHQVVTLAGEIVAHIVIDSQPTALRVVDLSIAASARQRGIEQAILERVCRTADERCVPVDLSALAGNPRTEREPQHDTQP